MECHFFPGDMGRVTVVVSHSNHILHGKQDEWDWELPWRRGEVEREKEEPSSLCPLTLTCLHHCLLHQPVLEPTVPLTASSANWGYGPFPDPCVASVPNGD